MRLFRSALLALLSCAIALCANARSLADIRKSGVLVVATEGQYPPFNYFKGSTFSGFEVELAEMIAKSLGLRVDWKTLAFSSQSIGWRQNNWDMVIVSHGITKEHAHAVSFAEPHYCSGGVIVARDPAIRMAQNLAGKVVAVQAGTTYYDKVRELSQAPREIRTYTQDRDARAALESGQADAWVSDQMVVLNQLATNRSSKLRIGSFLFIERVSAAAQKDNYPLLRAWNGALAGMMRDGRYAALSKKYFGVDIRCP